MKETIINISVVLAPILGSRDIAHNLKNLILKAKSRSVELNFKDVEFISRSAAHELLTLKDDLSHRFLRKRKISFVNTSNNVAEMLRMVAASRAVPKPREKYNIEKADANFLYNLPPA